MLDNSKTYERVITVRGIFDLIKKWWPVALAVVLIAGLFAGGKAVYSEKKDFSNAGGAAGETIEKEVKVKVSDAALAAIKGAHEFELVVADKEAYVNNSILMRIDPNHEKYAVIRCYITKKDTGASAENGGVDMAAKEAEEKNVILTGYDTQLKSTEVLEKLKGDAGIDADVSYFGELITTLNDASMGTMTVSLVYDDEQTLTVLEEGVQQFFADNAGIASGMGYNASVSSTGVMEKVDSQLAATQTTVKGDLSAHEMELANRMGTLDETALSYLELYREAVKSGDYKDGQTLVKTKEVEIKAPEYKKIFVNAFIKWAAVAAAAVFIIAALLLIFCPLMMTPQQMQDMYRQPLLAVLGESIDKEKKKLGTLLKSCCGDEPVIISSARDIFEDKYIKELLSGLDKDGIKYKTAQCIDTDPAELEKLKNSTGVILLERVASSKHAAVSKELMLISAMGIKTIGAVVFGGKKEKEIKDDREDKK